MFGTEYYWPQFTQRQNSALTLFHAKGQAYLVPYLKVKLNSYRVTGGLMELARRSGAGSS